MQKHILIVGAGLSGLTAAWQLQAAGHRVTVFDKGRGVGGRMATRRMGEARCDHGAQYFSATTPAFQALVQKAAGEGVLQKYYPRHLIDAHPRWIGTTGMTALPKYLSEPLNIKIQQRVTRLSAIGNRWQVATNRGENYAADALILTMPAPQALTLLHDSDLVLPDAEAALSQIGYHPCLAVLAALNTATKLPPPGTLLQEDHPIAWMADNFQKGITGEPTLTIHVSPAFSREYLDGNLDVPAEKLLQMAAPHLGSAKILDRQIHRWRYSLAYQRYHAPFYAAKTTAPLLFGGDGFGNGNVEGAFTSGLAIAEFLTRKYKLTDRNADETDGTDLRGFF